MNQDVEKLWELQTVLTALGEREKQLSSKPESFAAVRRSADGLFTDRLYWVTRDGPIWGLSGAALSQLAARVGSDERWNPRCSVRSS